MKLPLPEFLPDQSDNSQSLDIADGVFPIADGYAPVKAFIPVSDALPATFKGGASFIADDGTSYLLAGTANGLVRYAAGGWASLVVALSVSEQWRFASFGNFAIAVNGVATQVVDLNAGTASVLSGAPIGKSITVVGDYVVIGQAANDLLRITTSEVADHTKWDVVNTGATSQQMLEGGEVMGLAGGEFGVILQRRRIVRMNRTGDDSAPFVYDPITENVGCASRASVASYGRTVFFLSDSGFMALEDGQALVPIGTEKVDRSFQAEVAPSDYEKLFCAVDPQRKLVAWCFPNGKTWIYNFVLKRWSTRTGGIEAVFSGFTSSSTLEELDDQYTALEDVPFSLDDPRLSGGSPQFYAIAGNRLGSLSGDNVKATFRTAFFEPFQGATTRFREFRPVTDCIGAMSFKLDARLRMGDPERARTTSELRTSGAMPIRHTGRYSRITWIIEAGARWNYAQAVEIEASQGGRR